MSGTNVLICGLYFSGSGALKDLLSEYSSTSVIPGEFDDFRRAGLVGDNVLGLIAEDYPSKVAVLTRNCMESSSLYSSPGVKKTIKNRIKYKFLKSRLGRFSPALSETRRRIMLAENLESNLIESEGVDNSCALASKWIEEVSDIYSTDSQFNIFDQPIFLSQHSDIWPKIFDPFKLFIVVRDPRDQLAEIIRHKNLFKDYLTPTQGIIAKYGSGREAAIKYQLDMSFSRLENALKLRETLGSENVQIVRFEDLVQNTDHVKSQVEGFLGLKSSDQSRQGELFRPEDSAKNIGIYKEILNPSCLPLFDDYLGFMNKIF